MAATETQWDEAERTLLASVPADYPFDPEIVPLVVALNLLGFPTIGSCAGHPWDGVDMEGPWMPYVAMRWRLPPRIQRNLEESSWMQMTSGDRRERHALALTGWTVYRPAAWQLRGLLDEFYTGHAGCRLIRVGSTCDHVALRALESLWELPLEEQNEAIGETSAQFHAFGVWLQERLFKA